MRVKAGFRIPVRGDKTKLMVGPMLQPISRYSIVSNREKMGSTGDKTRRGKVIVRQPRNAGKTPRNKIEGAKE